MLLDVAIAQIDFMICRFVICKQTPSEPDGAHEPTFRGPRPTNESESQQRPEFTLLNPLWVSLGHTSQTASEGITRHPR